MNSLQVNILDRLVMNATELVDQGYYSDDLGKNNDDIALPSFRSVLEKKFALLGEIKPGSPTRGRMYSDVSLSLKIDQICPLVDGISVLTEPNYFHGNLETLRFVRQFGKPVLMKDFIIHERQIDVAQASAILLIERILSEKQISYLTSYAQKGEKEVILEVDNEEDFVKHIDSDVDILAVNNRNLKSMQVDPTKAETLVSEYNPDRPILGLSGYSSPDQVLKASENGLSGVLIGTALSERDDPSSFLSAIREVLK